MFSVPELDDMVCSLLGRCDLVQCARVNKEWHAAVIPHLWRDFRWTFSDHSREAFCKVVLEDYHYERGRQQLRKEQGPYLDQHALPTFTKYVRYIRTLPSPQNLYTLLKDTEVYEENAILELVHHLYSRCPGFSIPFLSLAGETLDNKGLIKTIIDHVIPHVHHLNFTIDSFQQSLTFKQALDHSPGKLGILGLTVLSMQDEEEQKMNQEQQASESQMYFRELCLIRCPRDHLSESFWSWFWKRCSQVETLEIRHAGRVLQHLPKAIQYHMPNISAIRIDGSPSVADNDIEAILSSCRQGWRQVTLTSIQMVGKGPMTALVKHSATLESLVINVRRGPPRQPVIQILAHCPHLHTFNVIEDCDGIRSTTFYMSANVFIDQDTCSGKLRPWKCEASLRRLGIKITNIPRPDSDGKWVMDEKYPGQGREIQSLVYDRLARLINLEELYIGKPVFSASTGCLEMSLESGLGKLAGLKQLKVLDTRGMDVRIKQQEAQWMVEHWPKLGLIYGLFENEAYDWIQRRHPHIELVTVP